MDAGANQIEFVRLSAAMKLVWSAVVLKLFHNKQVGMQD
jgi:hypothetical protein